MENTRDNLKQDRETCKCGVDIIDEQKKEKKQKINNQANLNSKQEKQTWEGWLDEKFGKDLEEIRKKVSNICNIDRNQWGPLPYYTPHNEKHFQRVEDLIHRLIPGEEHKKLSQREKFYLLASAWLHDLGMLRYVNTRIYGICPQEHEIRKNHHLTSEKYIVNYWSELGINEKDKEVLGKLCKFHRRCEDINECEEEFIIENEKVRLRLLAAYLRLADALDIDLGRTPSEPYMICLAYDMPHESKLHWIKSRLINGIHIDAKNHCIEVQFKIPYEKDLLTLEGIHSLSDKLNSIIKIVSNDLREELYHTLNVLIKNEDLPYYLDIITKKVEVSLDDRMLFDLKELIINYDIMMAPSASRIIEMVIHSLASLLGCYITNKNEIKPYIKTLEEYDANKVLMKVSNFIETLEKNILTYRPCHLGVRKLVNDIIKKAKTKKNRNGDADKRINDLRDLIQKKYQSHCACRHKIRINAADLFGHILKNQKYSLPEGGFKILLFGYSELVVKALCGFRDHLLMKFLKTNNNLLPIKITPQKLYHSPLEREISDYINIFICDCQPKTQTAFQDRLIYHDASQYALYLKDRNFSKITIIPDILSLNLLENLEIDFILFGANGLTKDFFIHSAGHKAILSLAQKIKEANEEEGEDYNEKHIKPYIILITTTEKFYVKYPEQENITCPQNIYEVDGIWYQCLEELLPTRESFWLTRDKNLLEKLYSNKICFLNPREDRICFKDGIDFILLETEKKFLDVKDPNFTVDFDNIFRLSESALAQA